MSGLAGDPDDPHRVVGHGTARRQAQTVQDVALERVEQTALLAARYLTQRGRGGGVLVQALQGQRKASVEGD